MSFTLEDENGRPVFTPKRASEIAYASKEKQKQNQNQTQERYVLAGANNNPIDDSAFIEQVAKYFAPKTRRDVADLSRQLHSILYRG